MTDGRTQDLTRYAWLSIAAAVATIGLKTAAWWLTGSVGLLSDAAESVVNLVAAFAALAALHVAARPADEGHHFGHSKAEYFSAALEGIMIFIAASVILVTSVERFFHPRPLENVGIGLAVSVVASVVNGWVAHVLLRAGRAHRSMTLIADSKHLMTDVWTSAGVVIGVILVVVTKWNRLDAIVAFVLGINIIVTGYKLVTESMRGLMDARLPDADNAAIVAVLQGFSTVEVSFHGLRTLGSGQRRHATFDMLVPGTWTVLRGHDLVEDVEDAIRAALPGIDLRVHLEPREDPRAYADHPIEIPIPLTPTSPSEVSE